MKDAKKNDFVYDNHARIAYGSAYHFLLERRMDAQEAERYASELVVLYNDVARRQRGPLFPFLKRFFSIFESNYAKSGWNRAIRALKEQYMVDTKLKPLPDYQQPLRPEMERRVESRFRRFSKEVQIDGRKVNVLTHFFIDILREHEREGKKPNEAYKLTEEFLINGNPETRPASMGEINMADYRALVGEYKPFRDLWRKRKELVGMAQILRVSLKNSQLGGRYKLARSKRKPPARQLVRRK